MSLMNVKLRVVAILHRFQPLLPSFDMRRSVSPLVLHLTSMTSTKFGSLEQYLVELARACTKRGCRTVIQYENRPASEEYIRSLRHAGGECVVARLGSGTARGLVNVLRVLEKTRPTILHTHFTPLPVRAAASALARLLGVERSFAMVHGNYPVGPGPRGAIKAGLLRAVAVVNDRTLAVSDTVRQTLLAAGIPPARVATHHLGLFGDRSPSAERRAALRAEFGIPAESVVFATISFDEPVKGLDVLLPAFRQANEQEPSLRLVQIGVDPRESRLPEMTARLGVADRVHWAGIRNRGWQLLDTADIYVMSSRSEGLNLAVLEAMAMRLPVVGTNVSGMQGEAVIDGETAILVSPDDVGSLARAMLALARCPDRWRPMGNAGRARLEEHFRGEDSVRRLVEEHYGL